MRSSVSGLFIALGAVLTTAGCLPDPDIRLPDLSLGSAAVDGGDGGVSRSDGPRSDLGSATWQADSTAGSAQTLRAAWLSDAGGSEIYVVGHAGLILHKSGPGAWQSETSGTTANLYAVVARSPSEVFAVGDRGVILRRTAGKWQAEGSELVSTAALFSAVALASGEVIAVGDNGMVARRQPAGVWAAESAPALSGTGLRAIAGSRLEALTAVGMNSAILRRGAMGWDRDPLPIETAGRGNYYALVENPGDGTLTACGEYGVVLTRLGDRWAAEKRTPPMGMTSPLHLYALTIAEGELFVVGAGGYLAHRLAGAGTWTEEQSPSRSDLFGLAGLAARGLVAVGDAGSILRRL